MLPALNVKASELPPEARHLYYLLSASPIDQFSVGSAAAILGCATEESSPLLDALVKADLLNAIGADAFRFYPITLWHARENSADLTSRAIHDALGRLVTWYLAGAINASGVVRPYRRDAPDVPVHQQVRAPQFESPGAALGWLEAEMPQIYTLAKHLAGMGHTGNREALTLLAQLWALWAYRKDFELWESCDVLALQCAEAVRDVNWQGRIQRRLGLLCTHVGRYAEASGFLEEATASFDNTDDPHRAATALGSLGVLYLRSGQVDEAAEQLTLAYQLLRERGDKRQAALVLIDLAAAQITRDRPGDALELLAQAEQVLAESPDVPSRARILMVRGRTHGRMGDAELARAELDEAAERMRECGSITGLAEALVYLAELAKLSENLLVMHKLLHEADALLDEARVPAKGWLRAMIVDLESVSEPS